MESVTVKLDRASYPVLIDSGSLSKLGEHIARHLKRPPRRIVLVSNPTVAGMYGRRAETSLRRAGFAVDRYLINDGERFKSLKTAEALYGFMIERRVERADVIVALGGGVVGDLAGFVAGTYLCGLNFINVPTTLLAQIDSSVGGKTGVNHRLGKNLIGVFHQPSMVLIDQETLRTLPARELRAGLCEAIKYGVIRDRLLFDWIADSMESLRRVEPDAVSHLIKRSCEIKAEVVENDEREGGL